MKARDLFEAVINNKMPTLDIIDAIEEIGDEGNGVTKKNLELMFSDFSWYLQNYVDRVLKKRESDEQLIESYNRGENEKFRNAYIIQEYYEDAGLSKNQMLSILKFIGILHTNIERIEYLHSDKVTMAEAIGDSYKEGASNSFFAEVHEESLSELEVYSRVQKLTDDFDPIKIRLLCKDFDYFFHWEMELWEGKFSQDEIDERIKDYQEADKKIPMMGMGDQGGMVVSDFFKPENKIKTKPLTEKQKKKRDETLKEMHESLINTINTRKLMDPHGIEFYSLYRLRNLLIQLKAEYTSAILKPEFRSKFGSSKPTEQNKINSIPSISWLKSDESRKQFIEALKEHNLIKSRDTEAIIKNHFEPHREQNSKPEPIKWLETIALLAYMIESLDEQYIKPENIWSDTAPHFSVNGKTPKNLRQSAKNYKNNKKGRAGGLIGKPKNHEIIDSIIQSLPE